MLSSLAQEIHNIEHPRRIALSKRYPILSVPIVYIHRLVRSIANLQKHIARTKMHTPFSNVLIRHQSPLMRKLGEHTEHLQRQKITNLSIATRAIDGVIIHPGETFSFWALIGNPTVKRGYVHGMLLSSGKVIEGVGGGLCQLSNLLYWMFLHSPLTITERKHHSMDVFPDSGRTLPFGSGATVMYNFIDLQARNDTKHPIQVSLSRTTSQLVGKLRTRTPLGVKYHIYEKDHCFIHNPNGVHAYYRHNEIWRDTACDGNVVATEHVTSNLAPVLYHVSEEYLTTHGFQKREIS